MTRKNTFQKSGADFHVRSLENLDLHSNLPPNTFTVKFDDLRKEFYLSKVDDFILPEKLYGDTEKMAVRMLNTFKDRKKSTGVLLCGAKGSGKSLLAKKLAVDAGQEGMPTIVVSEDYTGELFYQFMQKIEQPAIVIFDEFEKVYGREQQEGVLTLLDGTFSSNKLYVITCNDKFRLDSNLHNRPGRIFYSISYAGLSTEFIKEYCDDKLNAKNNTDDVLIVSSIFSDFNFDMLQSLVEEMNRYNETAREAVKYLNIRPEHDDKQKFDVVITAPGLPPEAVTDYEAEVITRPLMQDMFSFGLYVASGKKDPNTGEPEKDYKTVYFSNKDLKQINIKNGAYMFVNKEGFTLALTKREVAKYEYYGPAL